MRKHLGQIDFKTGEIIQGVIVSVGVKCSPYGNDWFMANQQALLTLAQDKDITRESYRVLMVLLGRLNFENWIHVPHKEIAEMLHMHASNVSRAIKLLERKGILLRSTLGSSRLYGYRLNPYYGWKGKSKKLQNARLELVKG
jgi:MarR family protein